MTKLDNMIKEIEELASTINVRSIIDKFDWSRLPEIYTWTQGKYYSCLAAAAKILDPNKILEIGTFTGASALCLAHYGHQVDTYDIEDKILDQTIKKQINFRLLGKPEDCVKLPFNEYDLIFIDIGMHEGIFEKTIHERLVTEHYKGIVLWDDIDYNWQIKALWESIKQEKISTGWNEKGFGVVLYD